MPTNEYAGQRMAGLVRNVLFLIAAIALVAGPSYWINGLTQPLVRVEGPLRHGIRLPVPAYQADQADQQLSGISIVVPKGSSARATIYDADAVDGQGAQLGHLTKVLWRSDSLVLGLTVAAGALLLGLLARDIRAGNPFAQHNPRRIALVGACIAIGGIVPPFLGFASTVTALGDAGLDADQPLLAVYSVHFAPLFGAVAVLVLAQAFRQGARVTEDVEGLV